MSLFVRSWNRVRFTNGEYEGEFADGKPNGYGRLVWEKGVCYHGEVKDQMMHGQVCLHPKPATRNPKPETRKPETRNPNRKPEPETET